MQQADASSPGLVVQLTSLKWRWVWSYRGSFGSKLLHQETVFEYQMLFRTWLYMLYVCIHIYISLLYNHFHIPYILYFHHHASWTNPEPLWRSLEVDAIQIYIIFCSAYNIMNIIESYIMTINYRICRSYSLIECLNHVRHLTRYDTLCTYHFWRLEGSRWQ